MSPHSRFPRAARHYVVFGASLRSSIERFVDPRPTTLSNTSDSVSSSPEDGAMPFVTSPPSMCLRQAVSYGAISLEAHSSCVLFVNFSEQHG